ncbi:BC85_0335 family putative methyltransferase [Metamycoplasma spumans]|uniref:BC85_0335 family putative methyltransferase n=1 Tax=Metamycoplasma spumans TaxID=92406 RepID=UPI0034DD05D0
MIAQSIINNTESKISSNARLALIISIIVVMLIAISIVIASFLLRRKYMKEIISPEEKIRLEQLKIQNPNYGQVLTGIKDFYNQKQILPDFLVTYLVNSVYLNSYENVLVDADSDYLSISLASLTYKNTYAIDQNINKQDKNAQNKYPNLDLSKLNYINDTNANQKFNMLVLLDNDKSHEYYLNKYIDLVDNEKNPGMIILNYTNKKDYLNSIKLFQSYNLKYEVAHFKHKNVILLAKIEQNSN